MGISQGFGDSRSDSFADTSSRSWKMAKISCKVESTTFSPTFFSPHRHCLYAWIPKNHKHVITDWSKPDDKAASADIVQLPRIIRSSISTARQQLYTNWKLIQKSCSTGGVIKPVDYILKTASSKNNDRHSRLCQKIRNSLICQCCFHLAFSILLYYLFLCWAWLWILV